MQNQTKSRRNVITGIAAALAGLTAVPKTTMAALTPSATEGPFYPTKRMRKPDTDNDLVKITSQVREAGGDVIILKGHVTDRNGHPLQGARVEIWQCDVNGIYMHPGDRRSTPHDPAFQGFGHDITDSGGRYRFRTIKPTKYPGRTPHIHVKVLKDGSELLTTQFYIKDDPGNARDSLFRRMSAAQRKQVEMVFYDGADGPETTINISL